MVAYHGKAGYFITFSIISINSNKSPIHLIWFPGVCFITSSTVPLWRCYLSLGRYQILMVFNIVFDSAFTSCISNFKDSVIACRCIGYTFRNKSSRTPENASVTLLLDVLPLNPWGLTTNLLAFNLLSFLLDIPVLLSSSARLTLLILNFSPDSSFISLSACVKISCKSLRFFSFILIYWYIGWYQYKGCKINRNEFF